MNFQGMGCRRFCGRCLRRGPIDEPGEGVCSQGTEIVEVESGGVKGSHWET